MHRAARHDGSPRPGARQRPDRAAAGGAPGREAGRTPGRAPARMIDRTPDRARALMPDRTPGRELAREPVSTRVVQALGRQVARCLGRLARGAGCALVALAALLLCLPAARANDLELSSFDLAQTDDGLFLGYSVNLELSRAVDDALGKAVPLFFVAEAQLFRNRFYWRDQRVGTALRRWRIVYQPLTSTYRVTFDGGLSQNYATRPEAFDAISRSARWKIAEAAQIEEGSRHYVEFSYRLDTAQLPRPMQIGIGGQADWSMSVKRTQRIN